MAWREDAHIKKLRVENLYHGSPGSWGSEVYPASGYASGYRIARGSETVTGTLAAGSTIDTGLTTVVAFAALDVAADATAANKIIKTSIFSIDGGTVIYRRWKHSGASTPTLVAATDAGVFKWIAVGT